MKQEKKVVIAGFEPFLDNDINVSERVVTTVSSQSSQHLNIADYVLPVEYDAMKAFCHSVNWADDLDAVVLLGMNSKSSLVTLEQRAWNRQNSVHSDMAGVTRVDSMIDESAPAYFDTKLDIDQLATDLSSSDLPVKCSLYPGEYVCNSLYFNCLQACKDLLVPVVFIHLPPRYDSQSIDLMAGLVFELIERITSDTETYKRKHAALQTQEDAEAFLYGFINYERKTGVAYTEMNYSLERFSAFLKMLGNPHLNQKYIHIAGTKGKGATCSIVSAVLVAHGYRTGFFSSPHLVDIRERFRLNGKAILPEDFLTVVSWLHGLVVEGSLPVGYRTTFELMTAAAFRYFQLIQADWIVLETGMGGRLDCTNVVSPEVTAITRVDYDHMDSLGHSLTGIAGEKAGIGKKDIPLIIGQQIENVYPMIETVATQLGAEVIAANSLVSIDDISVGSSGISFRLEMSKRIISEIRTGFQGLYQVENCRTAFAILDNLESRGLISLNEASIRKGLSEVRWPGRFTVVDACEYGYPGTKRKIVLDGAHNPAAIRAVSQAMREKFPGSDVVTVLALPENKDCRGFLRDLSCFCHSVICTQYQNARAMKPMKLREIALEYIKNVRFAPDFQSAIRIAMECGNVSDVILVTGSLYLVGEAMKDAGLEEMCLTVH